MSEIRIPRAWSRNRATRVRLLIDALQIGTLKRCIQKSQRCLSITIPRLFWELSILGSRFRGQSLDLDAGMLLRFPCKIAVLTLPAARAQVLLWAVREPVTQPMDSAGLKIRFGERKSIFQINTCRRVRAVVLLAPAALLGDYHPNNSIPAVALSGSVDVLISVGMAATSPRRG